MNYKKKYNELVEKLTKAKEEMIAWLEKQGKNNMGISEATKQELEDKLNNALEKETPESWNEFLEKQGEQKFEQKFFINDKVVHKATGKIWTIHHYLKDTNSYYVEDNDGLLHHYRESELKLVEQKPTDKVEPKFKVDDWIITNKKHIWYVDETPETTSYLYRLINQYGKVEVAEFEIVDEKARLWTIQDAKDGDVLADGNLPFIFKKIDANKYSYAYCGISVDDGFRIESDGESGEWTWMQDIKPATKIQRDLLFQKMKEAGYEWSEEFKEIRKIPTPADVGFAELGETWKKEANAIAERQKPAWSEEDEERYLSCLQRLSTGNIEQPETVNTVWFKSLKDRVQPKQEWSKEIREEFERKYNEGKAVGIEFAKNELSKSNTDIVWSEEDRNKIADYLYCLNVGFTQTAAKQRAKDICDLLCPQKHWKPSDEQMTALRRMKAAIAGEGEIYEPLNSLYGDLKKLREE